MNDSLPALNTRNRGLDMVKWIALLTMVVDHLRFVWPGLMFLLRVGPMEVSTFVLRAPLRTIPPSVPTAYYQ